MEKHEITDMKLIPMNDFEDIYLRIVRFRNLTPVDPS